MATMHALTRRLARCLSDKLDQLQPRMRNVAESLRDALADVVGSSLAETLATVIRELLQAVSGPQYERYGRPRADYWGEPVDDWEQLDGAATHGTDPRERERRTTWRQAAIAVWQSSVWLMAHARRANWRWGSACAGAALGAIAFTRVPSTRMIAPFSHFAQSVGRWLHLSS